METAPLWAVPQWRRAVAAAGGQCQCDTSTGGHTHHTHDRRCPRRQGEEGTRLYLARDGKVRCGPCHDRAESIATAAETAAKRETAPQMDSLF